MKQRVRFPTPALKPGVDASTASVDYETDRNIQDTVAHEFRDRTILCIARTSLLFFPDNFHLDRFTDRLRTIISYDRICVLDAGQIVVSIFLFDCPQFHLFSLFSFQEFDTAINLYDRPNGIFRGMCERSSITMDDLKFATKAKIYDA
jgi:hypothetical protein